MDWTSLVAPAVRAIDAYQPGITEEKLRRVTGLDRIFKFASNEVPFGPSPAVEAAMCDALRQVNRYPDSQDLLDALAAHLQVPAQCLCLGNGSIDVIESVVRVFVDERHNVVLSRYGYSAFAALVKAQGASIRWADSGPGYSHNVDSLLAQVDASTRMMIIDSPSNLSGQWVQPTDLQRLLRALPSHVIVLLDEAYAEFVEGDYAQRSAQLPLSGAPLISTRTFSKAYGLAGLRIGYGIAASTVISQLSRISPPFPVSGVALAGARAALSDRAHIEHVVAATLRGRRRLAEALSHLGFDARYAHGNFILADFGQFAQSIYERALARGYILRSLPAYGLRTHLRVSIGTSEEVSDLIDLFAELSRGCASGPSLVAAG
jgi:histidinol-phosphate aminotransferase